MNLPKWSYHKFFEYLHYPQVNAHSLIYLCTLTQYLIKDHMKSTFHSQGRGRTEGTIVLYELTSFSDLAYSSINPWNHSALDLSRLMRYAKNIFNQSCHTITLPYHHSLLEISCLSLPWLFKAVSEVYITWTQKPQDQNLAWLDLWSRYEHMLSCNAPSSFNSFGLGFPNIVLFILVWTFLEINSSCPAKSVFYNQAFIRCMPLLFLPHSLHPTEGGNSRTPTQPHKLRNEQTPSPTR